MKEEKFLHTRKPLTGGIRGSFGTSEGSAVQHDRCSKGKWRKFTTEIVLKGSIQPRSDSHMLMFTQSEWGLGAEAQAVGIST